MAKDLSLFSLDKDSDKTKANLKEVLGVDLNGTPGTQIPKVKSNTSKSPQLRNVIIGTEDPSDSVGENGDIYFKYTE